MYWGQAGEQAVQGHLRVLIAQHIEDLRVFQIPKKGGIVFGHRSLPIAGRSIMSGCSRRSPRRNFGASGSDSLAPQAVAGSAMHLVDLLTASDWRPTLQGCQENRQGDERR